ncbi:response regulator [Streptomyces platensis]|uniref:response regulator n=1 Tax=Streptomyces platensis TaxID=58346 RepID=UPI0033F8E250
MPASAPLPLAAPAAPASSASAVSAPRGPFALLNDEPVAEPGADLLGAGRAARAARGAADTMLHGVHILWVDDHPRNNESLVNAFRAAGAVVRIAEDSAAADAALAVERPTMIVSDIDRGGNPREGLEHIGRLRQEGGYTGPVVFYAGRVTPERTTLTRQLGAHLTSSGPEIERLVLRAAAGELSPPG